MKAAEIVKNYKKIKYQATDGKEYYLHEKYPICIRVADSEEEVFLDTGGEMTNCFFMNALIKENVLYGIAPETGGKPQRVATVRIEE